MKTHKPCGHVARRGMLILCCLIAAALCFPAAAGAEELWSERGFFVDLPAGFRLAAGDGKSSFSFADPLGGMEFTILVSEPGRYASARAAAEDRLKKIGSTGEREDYSYESRPAVFAELSFKVGGEQKRGYAIFIQGRKAGFPAAGGSQVAVAKAEPDIALLAFASSARFDDYGSLILSALDAFSIDRAARRAPGPLSQYMQPWPATPDATRGVLLPGGSYAQLPWSEGAAREELAVAEREHAVLAAYAQNDRLWAEAWGRFYRMIYRQSAARLDRLALECARVLPLEDPTESARRVLAWVQGFVYERDESGIDFVPPLASAYEGRGDCDSRAMVMAIILGRLGIDTILMLSREYSHAMAAVDVPGGGQRFRFDGADYLVAETTAKVGLGMIAKEQADYSKWMGLRFGSR